MPRCVRLVWESRRHGTLRRGVTLFPIRADQRKSGLLCQQDVQTQTHSKSGDAIDDSSLESDGGKTEWGQGLRSCISLTRPLIPESRERVRDDAGE